MAAVAVAEQSVVVGAPLRQGFEGLGEDWVSDDLIGIEEFEISYQPAVLTHQEAGTGATVETEQVESTFDPIPALKWVQAHDRLSDALAEIFEATTSQLVASVDRGIRDGSIVLLGPRPTERQPIVKFFAHDPGSGDPWLCAIELCEETRKGSPAFATLTFTQSAPPRGESDVFVTCYRSLLGVVGTCGIGATSFAVDLQSADLVIGGMEGAEPQTRFSFATSGKG